MTVLTAPETASPERVATRRHYLMCPPEHFAVSYAINPWMDVTVPVDRDLALRQWSALRATYERLGHRVDVIDAAPGLPDMVFAANGGLVVGGRATRPSAGAAGRGAGRTAVTAGAPREDGGRHPNGMRG